MKTDFFERETDLEKSMEVLKEIITVIMALAFTHALIQFLVDSSTSKVYHLNEISFEAWLILFLIITTIVRFYHGNMRHLSTTYSKEKLIDEGVSGVQLPIDFFFLILQSMIFVVMGFYESEFSHLYFIFVSLFIVDSVWFLLLGKGKIEFVLKEPQTQWILVNISTVIILCISHKAILGDDHCIPIFSLIIIANLFLDYSINWKFYFPKIPRKDKISVFVSAPFSSKLQENKIDRSFKETLDKLISFIEKNSRVSSVYSAHRIEEWGNLLRQSTEYVPRDYEALLKCDVVIAYLDGSPSMGMPIELGWAVVLKKSIIILSNERTEPAAFVEGFPKISNTVFIIYKDMEELFQKLNECFAKIH